MTSPTQNRVPKMRIHSLLLSLLAAVLLTASPAFAHSLVAFNGSLQGTESDTPQGGLPPATLIASGKLPGLATLFGQFTFNYTLTVILTTTPSTAAGSGTLITIDGDRIFTDIKGLAMQTTNATGISLIAELNTITGGTGKFAGAKGFFIVERLANLPPGTGLTSGAFHGTIVLPK
jgi:hypothetical protein